MTGGLDPGSPGLRDKGERCGRGRVEEKGGWGGQDWSLLFAPLCPSRQASHLSIGAIYSSSFGLGSNAVTPFLDLRIGRCWGPESDSRGLCQLW